MQKAGFIGRPLDQMLQEGMRLAYDKHMDQSAYVGLSEYGTTGLLNHSEAAETTVKDNGAAAPSTKWKDKTPRQMLDDVNGAILSVWEAEEYEPVLCLDEFRSSLLIGDMLDYLDGYPLALPARYANRQAWTIWYNTRFPIIPQFPGISSMEAGRYSRNTQNFWRVLW